LEKSSKIMGVKPALKSSTAVCDPMYPAPPVINIFFILIKKKGLTKLEFFFPKEIK
jgi:hypothetical protein